MGISEFFFDRFIDPLPKSRVPSYSVQKHETLFRKNIFQNQKEKIEIPKTYSLKFVRVSGSVDNLLDSGK